MPGARLAPHQHFRLYFQEERGARGGPSSRGTIAGEGTTGATTGVGARVTGAVGRAPDTRGAPDTTGTGDAGTGTNTCM